MGRDGGYSWTIRPFNCTEICGTFGCPLEVHTDQGRNVDGTLFSALCEALEITKTRTTLYHPCANGQVKRFNTIVLQMVRCYIEKKNKDWDRDLPILATCMTLHSMVNRQTSFTPNRLMLGRETVQPIHFLLGTMPHCFKKLGPHSWICHLAKSIYDVYQIATDNLRAFQHHQKRDYDLRLVEKQYVMGDLVLKLDSSTKIGQSKKLRSPWVDPFVVAESFPPLYRIRERGGDTVIHHDRL